MVLGLLSFKVSAQQVCAETKYSYKQCVFDIPQLEDGKEHTSIFNKFGLIGGVVSKCENGTVSFGAAICKPQDQTSCTIPETVWGQGDGGYCKHSAMPGVLENGNTKIALSETESQGRIVYSCDNGELKQENTFCTPTPDRADVTLSGQANNVIFGVDYKDCDSAMVLGKLNSRESGDVEAQLCNASGFDSLDYVQSAEPYPMMPGSDAYYHVEAMCSGNTNPDTACQTPPSDLGETDSFIQTLDCDTATVAGIVNSPNAQAPVGSAIESALCVSNGYSTMDTLLKLTQESVDGDVNNGSGEECFVGGAIYGSAYGHEDGDYCDVEYERWEYEGVEVYRYNYSDCRGAGESEWMIDDGYNYTVSSLNNGVGDVCRTPKDSSNTGSSYYAEAVCSGNANAESMCQTGTDTHVSVIDCDSAQVTGDIDGKYKIEATRPPTEAEVQEAFCVPNGYASIKEITNSLFTPSGLRGFYEVNAICQDNTAPTENCENSCMGELVADASSVPKIQGSDGRYYRDMCVDVPVPPAGFCEDCESADVTFFDASTGNTCTLYDQNVLTGEEKGIDFQHSDFNGSVEVSCNSSETTVISGECYKTCKGGSRAAWRDNYGSNSCGAEIPVGDYYQGETVSLGTDIHNGSAVFECNDGAWEQKGASQCLLDCDGSFSWGSGVSASGVNKNGVCRADVGLLKHNSTTTSRLDSTTPFTDGESDASCNDGRITSRNSRCDLDCRSETGYWGAGRCSNTIPNTGHDDIARISSPTPLTGYSGSAVFACGDGEFTLGASQCNQDCPTQTVSMNSCSYTASAAKHDAKAPYTSSTATVEASISHTCDDGRWTRDSGSYCTTGTIDYGGWSGWSNQGGRYNYSGWSPSRSGYFEDERFTQSRQYRQNQQRTRSVYMVFPPSSRRDFVRTETDTRTLSRSENREVTGTKTRSTMVWVDYDYEEYETFEDVCEEGVPTPATLGESCSTEGATDYYKSSCRSSDSHCQGDDRCGDRYILKNSIAVCESVVDGDGDSGSEEECFVGGATYSSVYGHENGDYCDVERENWKFKGVEVYRYSYSDCSNAHRDEWMIDDGYNYTVANFNNGVGDVCRTPK
jgi:hypothetical protein